MYVCVCAVPARYGNSVRLLCAEKFKGKVTAVEFSIKVHNGSRCR